MGAEGMELLKVFRIIEPEGTVPDDPDAGGNDAGIKPGARLLKLYFPPQRPGIFGALRVFFALQGKLD